MSLIRLLAVGRSIIGLKREPARYTMVDQNLLPKFESVKGPPGTVASPPISGTGTGAGLNTRRRPLFSSPFISKNGAKSSRPLVQTELALGEVKVMRNDLSDADVDVQWVPERAGVDVEQAPEPRTRTVEKPLLVPVSSGRSRGWSEMTARLFEAGGLRS